MSARRIWMVRTPRGRENAQDAEAGILPVDLGVRGDISGAWDMETAIGLIESDSPRMAKGRVESRARSLVSLVDGIMPGDVIVSPVRDRMSVAIGIAKPEMTVSSTGLPARMVEILEMIPEDRIPADLANSLSAKSAVCEIRLQGAEQRISEILSGKHIAPSERRDPGALLDGHDMSRLVAAILMADGYRCHVSSPGPDGGADILAGKGTLGFEGGLVAQVKSGRIICGSEDIDRLLGVMASRGAQYGLLASWGGFSRPAMARVSSLWFKLRLWGPADISERAASAAAFLDGELAEIALAISENGREFH